MNVTVRIGAFAAMVAVVSGLAWVAGNAWGPAVGHDDGAHASGASDSPADAHSAGNHASSAGERVEVQVDRTTFTAGTPQAMRFQLRQGHESLTRFDREGGVDMHLILVRGDLTRYQHLHPTLDGETWSTPVTLPDAGEYVAFIDFERNGERTVLQQRLFATGSYLPDLSPAPTDRVQVAGYDVELHDDGDRLRFTIERDGAPVRLEDYIGAKGHLVALHHDDLEYQHVHPLDASAEHEPTFAAEFQRPGTYRLFLQFRHDGAVHTAAFDREVRP